MDHKKKKPRPHIICLCGSSKFIEHFAILGWEFEKGGKIVLGLHLLPASYCKEMHPDKDVGSHIAEAEGVQDQMDELHLRKIDLADSVYVINIGGYIGESASREIAYAESLKKPISYMDPEIGDESENRLWAARDALQEQK